MKRYVILRDTLGNGLTLPLTGLDIYDGEKELAYGIANEYEELLAESEDDKLALEAICILELVEFVGNRTAENFTREEIDRIQRIRRAQRYDQYLKLKEEFENELEEVSQ